MAVAAVMTVSSLTACGGKTENTGGSEGGGKSSSAKYTLKVQSQDPENGATGRFLEEWASAVEEASDGRLEINIFHGGTLGRKIIPAFFMTKSMEDKICHICAAIANRTAIPYIIRYQYCI